MKKKKKLYLILLNSFFIGSVLLGLFYSDFLYNYLVGGSINFFGDYKAAIDAIICNQVESKMACPEYAYGKILTLLPYSYKLNFVYHQLIPYTVIFIFIFFTSFFFISKNKINFLMLYLTIFSPSTLLLIERLNLDILIIISIFIFSINRIYLINWLILINLTLLKIYPFILSSIILYENRKRNIYTSLTIISIITFLIFLLVANFDLFETINAYGTESKASFFYLFSFNHLPKLLKYSFGINYILSLSLLGFIFIYIVFKLCSKNTIFIDIKENSPELIIFNLGTITLIVCFLIYSNYYYREVFLICAFPFLLKKEIFQIKFIRYFIYFCVLRYIFEYIYSYISLTDFIYYIDNQRYFNLSFIIVSYFKSIFDLFLVVSLTYIFFIFNISFFIEKLAPLKKFINK